MSVKGEGRQKYRGDRQRARGEERQRPGGDGNRGDREPEKFRRQKPEVKI
jgi:hypothetical protein